jgi:transposase-like protein
MATAARYFDLIREMKKNAYNHRLRLVESVRIRGIKPTARLFAASPFTVRKWWRCYQQLGPSGLQNTVAPLTAKHARLLRNWRKPSSLSAAACPPLVPRACAASSTCPSPTWPSSASGASRA